MVGNGNNCFFWSDNWLQGRSLADVAPEVVKLVSPNTRACRTVAQAMCNKSWLKDIKGSLTIKAFLQLISLWERLRDVQLNPESEDAWSWSWESNGSFSSKSVYMAHFAALSRRSVDDAIWRAKAPLKCKFHMWLVSRKRIWTADRLAKRGLPHHDRCVMCDTVPEDCNHLFTGCVVANIIWNSTLQWANLQAGGPTPDRDLAAWWNLARNEHEGDNRKKLDSLCILVVWAIWRERKRRVFYGKFTPVMQVISQLKADVSFWFN